MRVLVVITLLVVGLGCASRPAAPERPNVLLILVDDLGPEWIGAYGAEGIETPHIDRLAATGMVFENAYSMPQCTPTRVTLLTGQYPFRHGWTNHWDVPRWGAGAHFDPDRNTTVARVLDAAGYATAVAGKWQINDFRVQPDILRRHGFDDWAMWTGFEADNPPSAERYWDPYIHTRDGSRTHEGAFGTDVFVDFLIDFMAAHRDEPQFLYFPMALTHPPLVPTPDEPEAETMMDRHRAMVRYMDRAVGRLVGALDSLGLRERTIVVFTTDNGTSRGITGRMNGREVEGGKGSLGENGARAPFIVNAPGRVPAGVRTDALTDFTDLFPTFLDLAGVPVPDSLTLDGRSIAPVLRGEADDSGRAWVLTMGFGPARLTDEGVVPVQVYTDRAIRDARYKLWIVDGRPAHLYDLVADPGETTDLIASDDPDAVAARERLSAVAASFPARDARPRYDPTPPQPWDRRPDDE